MNSSTKWFFFVLAILFTRNPALSIAVLIVFYIIQLSLEKDPEDRDTQEKQGRDSYARGNQDHSDIGLIYLSAYIIQVNNTIDLKHIEFVTRFLRRNFDENHVNHRILLLNRLVQMKISAEDGCRRVMYYYPIDHRTPIVEFLFSLAASVGKVSYNEMLAIRKIAQLLFVSASEFEHLKSLYFKETQWEQQQRSASYNAYSGDSLALYYTHLGLKSSATAEELKTAYRKKVLFYHPDKWINKTAAEQEIAKKKFIEIQDAYDKIKLYKNIK